MTLTPRYDQRRNNRPRRFRELQTMAQAPNGEERHPAIELIPFATLIALAAITRNERLPGASGWKVFLLRSGIRPGYAGAIRGRVKHLAPKYDSSLLLRM